jgi:hypothetical protein
MYMVRNMYCTIRVGHILGTGELSAEFPQYTRVYSEVSGLSR